MPIVPLKKDCGSSPTNPSAQTRPRRMPTGKEGSTKAEGPVPEKPRVDDSEDTANQTEDRAYEIGYGRPPKKTQFQPGQSGNPKGRRKGQRGLKTIIRECSTERIVMRTAQGDKQVPKIEAMIHKLMEKAFAGDFRSMDRVLQLYADSVPDQPDANEMTDRQPDLTETDRQTLADFEAMIVAETTKAVLAGAKEADDE